MQTTAAESHEIAAPAIDGLKYEHVEGTLAAAVDSPVTAAGQPSPITTGRTITTDTQQQPTQSRDGVSTPSVSQLSGPSSSQGTKVKGRSGPKSKHSPFIGVSQYKRTGRWEAHIWDSSSSTKGTPVSSSRGGKGKQLHLGSFPTAAHAAKAYDRAALLLRGTGAKLNFPLEEYQGDPMMEELSKLSRPQMILALRKSADVEAEEAALEAFSAKVPHLLQSVVSSGLMSSGHDTPSRSTGAAAAAAVAGLSSDGIHPSASLTHTLPSTPAGTTSFSGAAAAGASADGGYGVDTDWLQVYEQQTLQQQQQQQQQQGDMQLWMGQELTEADMTPALARSCQQQQQQQGEQGRQSGGEHTGSQVGHNQHAHGPADAAAAAAAAAGGQTARTAFTPPTSAPYSTPAGFSDPQIPTYHTSASDTWATHQPATSAAAAATEGHTSYPWPSQQQQQQQQGTALQASHSYSHTPCNLPYSYPHLSSHYSYPMPLQTDTRGGQHLQGSWHSTAQHGSLMGGANTPWLNNMVSTAFHNAAAGAAAAIPSVPWFDSHLLRPPQPPPPAAAAMGLSQHGTAQQLLAEQGSWQEYQLWRQQQHLQCALQGGTTAPAAGVYGSTPMVHNKTSKRTSRRNMMGDSASHFPQLDDGPSAAAAFAYQQSSSAAAAAAAMPVPAAALQAGRGRLAAGLAAAAAAAGSHGIVVNSSMHQPGHKVPTRSSSSSSQWLQSRLHAAQQQQQQYEDHLALHWQPPTGSYPAAGGAHFSSHLNSQRHFPPHSTQRDSLANHSVAQHGSYRSPAGMHRGNHVAVPSCVNTPPSAPAALLTGPPAAFQQQQGSAPWAAGPGGRQTTGTAANAHTNAGHLGPATDSNAFLLGGMALQQAYSQQQQQQQHGPRGPHYPPPLSRQHTPTQAAVLAAAAAADTIPQPGMHFPASWQAALPAQRPAHTSVLAVAGGSGGGGGGSNVQPPAAAATAVTAAMPQPLRQLSLGAQATLLAAWQADHDARTAAAAAVAPATAAAGGSVSLHATNALSTPAAAAAVGALGQSVRRTISGTYLQLARTMSCFKPGSNAAATAAAAGGGGGAIQRRTSSLSAELLSDLLLSCENVLYTQHSLPGLDQLDALLAGGNGSPTISVVGLMSEEPPPAAGRATANVNTTAAAAAAAGVVAAPTATAAAAGSAAVRQPSHAAPSAAAAAPSAAAIPFGAKRPAADAAVASKRTRLEAPTVEVGATGNSSDLNAAADSTAALQQTSPPPPPPPPPAAAAAVTQVAVPCPDLVAAAGVPVTDEGLAWLQLMKE